MSVQGSLFDGDQAVARDDAIERVARRDSDYQIAGRRWIVALPAGITFVSRDVREALLDLDQPAEPRILGAIIRTAAVDGLIAKTGRVRTVGSHCYPQTEWRRA